MIQNEWKTASRWFSFLPRTLGTLIRPCSFQGLVASRRDIVELLANDPRVVTWKLMDSRERAARINLKQVDYGWRIYFCLSNWEVVSPSCCWGYEGWVFGRSFLILPGAWTTFFIWPQQASFEVVFSDQPKKSGCKDDSRCWVGVEDDGETGQIFHTFAYRVWFNLFDLKCKNLQFFWMDGHTETRRMRR